MFMQSRADSLYILEENEDSSEFMEMLFLPAVFSIGDSWVMIELDTSWFDVPYTYIYSMVVTNRAQALEDVVVPAGTFESSLKLDMVGENSYIVISGSDTIHAESGTTFVNTMWFGEDIGPVKSYEIDYEDDTIGTVSVLLSYDLSGIDEIQQELPGKIELSTYPNPFNSVVNIRVQGVEGSRVRVEVFDINGKRVQGVEGSRIQGGTPGAEHRTQITEFIWTPDESLGSGVYLVRARFDPSTGSGHRGLSDRGNETVTKRVVYLK